MCLQLPVPETHNRFGAGCYAAISGGAIMRHEFRRGGILLIELLIVVPATAALIVTLSDGMEPQAGDAAAKFKQVLSDFNKAQSEFAKAEKAAKTDAERKAAKAKHPNMEVFAQRMLEIANGHPKDAAAYDALAWIVRVAPNSKAANPAINTLAKNHVSSDKIGGLCQNLGEIASPAADNLLRAILDKNPNNNARGLACFGLAQVLKRRYEDAQPAKKKANANALFKEVVAMYQRVQTEFADVKGPGRLLGAAAKAESFEFRFLVVGKTVPEVAGEDVDGNEFKLSDYRGKVVLLAFWGNW
jgi:AhpC/TSA family